MHTKSMTEGNPLKLILLFSLPLMFGNVFQQLYTVVDTIIVGQALGVDALASLGAAEPINWMYLGTIQGLAQGFSIRMAQEFGAGDEHALRRTIGSSILLSILLAIAMTFGFQAAAEPVLLLLDTPQSILPRTMLYLRIMFSGIPIITAYNLMACMLRSVGDSRTPLYSMIVAACVNIVLDLLFVCVFHWGIAGAAAATLIAQAVSVVYCFFVIRKISCLRPTRPDFAFDAKRSRRLMLLGLPMAFQNFIIAVGSMFVQYLVNSYGVLFIAGFTATNKLYGILEIAATSYGFAMVTYTGQNLGAEKTGRIREGLRSALLIAFVTSVLIAVILLVQGKNILLLFISGSEDEVSQTLQIAFHYLSIMSVCLPILYLLHITRSTLQGLGDTLFPMLSGIAEFLMRTGCVVFLPLLLDAEGIFYAEVLAWTGADLILVPACLLRVRKLKASI